MRTWVLMPCLLATAAACVGEIGGEDPFPQVPSESSTSAPAATTVACRSDGPVALPRLNSRQYDSTVRDLLGDTSHPGQAFATGSGAVFDTDVSGMSVSPALMEQFLTTAEDLSETATSDENLPRLLACDPSGAAEASCIRKFITDFGRKAYRRPLEADEIDRLLATYDEGRNGTDVRTGVQWILQRILVSPDFLYRVEVGTADASGARKLTPYEVATRLSYFLLGTMPDDALLAAAAENKLSTREQVVAQVRRMMRDAAGAPTSGADWTIKSFFSQWLGLQNLGAIVKDKTAFPEFDAQLVASMGEETKRVTADIFWTGGGLVTALTGRTSFVDGRLATLYGVANVQGDTFNKVQLPPEQRSGLLTQASFLATYAGPGLTSPTRRGAFIRTRLLCQPVAPPPPNVNTSPPAVDSTSTTRARLAAHAKDPFCASCHRHLDPVGFGLENFDALGRWRTTENGLPIDATGTIDDSDVQGGFKDAADLSAKLSASAEVRECLATQWFRYAYGREPQPADRCTIQAITKDFAAKDSFEDLVVSLATHEAFVSGWAVEEAQ